MNEAKKTIWGIKHGGLACNGRRVREITSMQVANAVRPSAILFSVQYWVAGGGIQRKKQKIWTGQTMDHASLQHGKLREILSAGYVTAKLIAYHECLVEGDENYELNGQKFC